MTHHSFHQIEEATIGVQSKHTHHLKFKEHCKDTFAKVVTIQSRRPYATFLVPSSVSSTSPGNSCYCTTFLHNFTRAVPSISLLKTPLSYQRLEQGTFSTVTAAPLTQLATRFHASIPLDFPVQVAGTKPPTP